MDVDEEKKLYEFLGRVIPLLDERKRRIFVGSLSIYLGHGSAKIISEMTNITQQTITAGRKECKEREINPKAKANTESTERIRAPGGGRKRLTEIQPGLINALLSLLDGNTIGDPSSPLTWTNKSTVTLAQELNAMGFSISHDSVGALLKLIGFSLQQNKKYTESGDPGPDRDEQFKLIKNESQKFIETGCPVISIDTKKKELVGNFKNNGSVYCPNGEPVEVNDHDFGTERASPYGVYDVGLNKGFVNVGISADTAQFAVNSIRSWWELMGRKSYPDAKDVLITADCGGSNGRRNRLWKVELQKLSNETGLTFHIHHYPPGTSKWNKIEHRMFSFISMNWRGRPLTSIEVIVNLIANTKNSSGLEIKCVQDMNVYDKGIKITDKELEQVNISHSSWHGEWNYDIGPQ